MLNKKIIIALTLALSMGTTVFANSNDLLKMDIKKSSAQDAVDVTFYTTGNSTNSVVTRKSGNNYVVLLPNVSGNQSIVPNLGGVKDLVTDIKVKNVDDGMGGYTKVTFSTTKPIKIQTSTQKTAPLTKAQQDYKNLIAQNSKFDPDTKMKNFKASPTATSTQKTAVQPTTKAQTQNTKVSDVVKKVQNTTKETIQPKVEKIQVKKQDVQPKAENIKPAVKPDVKPVAKTKAVESKPAGNKTVKSIQKDVQQSKTQTPKTTPANKQEKKFPLIPLAGLASVLGIFALGGIINAVSRSVVKNSNKIKNIFEESPEILESQRIQQEYNDIASNKNLNWQEKYKLYSQKEENNSNEDYSYVTDMSTTMKAIISPDLKVKTNIPSLNGKVKNAPTNDEKVKIQAKISQMEHALVQTPSLKSILKHKPEIHTEDEAITNSIKNIKLKSFAKDKKLSQTDRSLASNPIEKQNKHLKESRFVKLRNSALSMSHRTPNLSITNLTRINDNHSNVQKRENFGIVKSSVNKENYQLASLGEYLTILDSEEQRKNNSQIVTNAFESMGRMSNSIENASNPIKQRSKDVPQTINGLKVKSGYNIDSEKGFYIIEVDGSNELVGRINDEIFVIKKFENNANLNLQVRLDYDNVYIVRAGSYKCLVDVTENKMGTLLEI
ncbi:hypothetical protein J6G99_05205 [bacterium]|nr:hypothetical protein [bacterium]